MHNFLIVFQKKDIFNYVFRNRILLLK